jgi:hypothetical protein
MPDEDYSSYLKRQSYADLLAVSCSLDKESHPERYAMVLAEIAVRDNRGEKPEGIKPGKDRTRCVVFGSISTAVVAISLLTGHSGARRSFVSVTNEPVAYWLFVGVWSFGAIWSFCNVFRRWKK